MLCHANVSNSERTRKGREGEGGGGEEGKGGRGGGGEEGKGGRGGGGEEGKGGRTGRGRERNGRERVTHTSSCCLRYY